MSDCDMTSKTLYELLTPRFLIVGGTDLFMYFFFLVELGGGGRGGVCEGSKNF